MKSLPTLINSILGCIAILFVSARAADNPAPAAPAWSVQVYRLQPTDLMFKPQSPQDVPNNDPFAAPELKSKEPVDPSQITAWHDPDELTLSIPAENAPEAHQVDFIKRSTEAVRKVFKNQEIEVPEGSLFAYDAKTWTLAARTSPDFHFVLANRQDIKEIDMPTYMSFRLDILAADAAVIRASVQAASTLNDHTAILADLESKADQGLAHRIDSVKLDTKSGQKVKLTTGTELAEVTDFTWDEKFRVSFTETTTKSGLTIELDPISGEDKVVMDISGALNYDFAPTRKELLPAPLTSSRLIKVPVYQHQSTALAIHTVMKSGGTTLVGVWSTEASGECPKTLQAAFLRGEIVPLRPAENPLMATELASYDEKFPPPPPPPAPKPLPAGFEERTYRIPPRGFSLEPAKSAKELFERLAVTFPPEATVEYLKDAGCVRVISSPETLEFIQNIFEDICHHPIKNLTTTLHIIEADAGWLRKLERSTAALSDHSASWKEVESAVDQGQARILNTVFMTTRSGRRTTTTTGEHHGHVIAEAAGVPAALATPADAKDTPAAPAAQGSTAIGTGTVMRELVGTEFTLDPLIGEDQMSINADISLDFDYAAPSKAEEPQAGRKADLLETPQPTFHRVHLVQTADTLSGQWRLIGMWKPEGNGKDVMQAAFLRMDAVTFQPHEH